ncbi:MAG: DUF2155 domain-containing protein [Magnetococcales bacterium]|nr:DUF2155 domain-containing protein [Magnetococcales bacterium]
MATSTPKSRFRLWHWLLLVLLIGMAVGFYHGLPIAPQSKSKFVSIDNKDTNKTPRLPLAPHVHQLHARPDPSMIKASEGIPLRFRLLDKRTMRIDQLVIAVGELHAAPWGGQITPMAYAADLVVRDGEAVHGREGHVNPAVWVELRNHEQKKMHEGWMFARDSAQTAWEHPRFDLTFLGTMDTQATAR